MKPNVLRNSSLRGVLFLLLCIVGMGNVWGEKYKLITSTDELVAGCRYIIASMTDGSGAVMKNYVFDANNWGQIETNATNSYITYQSGMARLTLGGSSESWTFHNGSYYLDATSTTSSNHLKGSKDIDKYNKFSISFSNKAATIKCKGKESKNILRYNIDSKLFSCYNDGQKPVYIYKKVEEPEQTQTVTELTISGSASKTIYYVGETPSAEGLKVTATYNDKSTKDVTSSISWSFEPATILSNTTSVTATASYEEKSAQYTYNIINKGEKTFHDYTLDLSTNSYSDASAKTVKWDAVVASMTLSKGEGTYNANQYLGGSGNKETRFYTGHVIEITPKTTIHNIVFTTATSEGNTFASILCNSTYTNATASKNGNTVTITPKDGNNAISLTLNGPCGCTAMTVHYLPVVSTLTNAGYATLCLPYNATVPKGLTAYTATDNGENIKLTVKEGNKIAAGEGVVLKGDEGTYTFIATEGSVSATVDNQMVGVTKETQLTETDNAYMLTRKKDDGSIAFRLLKTNYTLGANKAYLKVDGSANTRELIPALWDDNATGIENTTENNTTNIIYNLAGQKLMHIQKGVNIINGKLIVK